MDTTPNNKTEEIDIIAFLKPIGYAIKSVVFFLVTLVKKWQKNWLVIVLTSILFGSIGFSAVFVLPKQYETSAIIMTHEIPADLCVLELENLNSTIKSEVDFSLISKQLNLSNKHAAAINSISAEKIEDIYFDKAKDSSSQLLSIKLRLTNPNIVDYVQTGIVQFLENNEYSKKRKEAKRSSLNELKINLRRKVESLDSLKSVVNNSIIPRGNGQGIILGEPIDPVSIYQAEVAYFKEQLKINEDLAILDNIEIIQPFIKIQKSNYPNFNLITLYSFLFGLFLSLLFVGFKRKA